jgi:hypothetical protein
MANDTWPTMSSIRSKDPDEDSIRGSRKQVVNSTDIVVVTTKDTSRDVSFFMTRLSRELRNVIGWNGIIISLGPEENLKTLSEPAARELYLHLKDRFEGKKATNGEILIGQVWKSNDTRAPDRKVEILEVGNTHAVVKNLRNNVRTRISLKGFKDSSRGYSLLETPS